LGMFALEHTLGVPGGPKSMDGTPFEYMKMITPRRPDPGYEKNIFGHDSLKTLIAKTYIQSKKIEKVTYIPAYINPNLEPEVVTRKDTKGQEVFDYVKQISEMEALNARFSWEGDEVLVS
jgi:hypothetical protein